MNLLANISSVDSDCLIGCFCRWSRWRRTFGISNMDAFRSENSNIEEKVGLFCCCIYEFSSYFIIYNAKMLTLISAKSIIICAYRSRCNHLINFVDMESRIAALERENTNLKFMNKQCSAQYKKLERDYVAQEKTLRDVRKCAACMCLGTGN